MFRAEQQADVAPLVTVQPEIVEPYAPDFDCPVTEPEYPGFEPPEGYPARPSDQAHVGPRRIDPEESVWYGSEDLWTVLSVDGDHSRGKSVWWSTAFPGGKEEPQPPIDVTWQRLDEVGSHSHGRGTNGHTAEDGWFMIAGIGPSDPGCWKVTAEYKGAELSYVYEIRS